MKSAAEPVGFAVLFGFVMLLAVFGEPVMSSDRQIRVLGLWRALRFFAATVLSVQVVNKRRVRGVAMLSFGVFLWPRLLAFVLCHHYSSESRFGTTRSWSG